MGKKNKKNKNKLSFGNGGLCYVDTEKLSDGFWEPIIPALSMAYLYANHFTEEQKKEVIKDLPKQNGNSNSSQTYFPFDCCVEINSFDNNNKKGEK